MKPMIASILAAATVLRLFVSLVMIPNITNDDGGDSVIFPSGTMSFPSGILSAISAAMVDPMHTWDHLEEACFWLRNNHSTWEESGLVGIGSDDDDGGDGVGYGSIYASGTRIVAPPLVVAFLGDMLVCSNPIHSRRTKIQSLLLLLADAIGAYCIYRVGMRIFDVEDMGNEAEMERRTFLRDKNNTVIGEGKIRNDDDDFVVPGILRPERGWIVDLPTKILLSHDESFIKSQAIGDTTSDDEKKHLPEDHQPKDGRSVINGCTTSNSLEREPLLSLNHFPIVAALSYFSNPISMVANATGSLRGLWDSLLLISFYYATIPPAKISKEGDMIKIPSATMVAVPLCMATYADAAYAAFLLPILLWRGLFLSGKSNGESEQHRDWKKVLVLFVVCLVGLHYFASLLVGGDGSAYRNVLTRTVLPNVAFVQQDFSGSVPGPSMGLHWYFFVQIFDRFRPYFTVFVSGIPAMFAIPLTIRMYRYPSVLASTFQLLWAIFRPTTTVHTLTFGLHLALLNPRTIVRMRNPSLISFCALPVPIILFIVFHRMWLVIGNGNPNYIFFQCLAYGMFVLIITMDFVSATVKRDKVRRMVEKGTIKKLARKKEGIEKEADDCHSTVSTVSFQPCGK
ncbi:hypothetical protein ACHAXA_009448 [Cyclostephanos tholiformis]|uniref:GPI transamidase subunit PIG-U n=1 Tax=Cyclostephanos tholiformis TaxID=382380 RepID=A0ABD3RCK4_9STRA